VNFLDERLPARFWDKCMPEPNSGCWLWTGAHNRYGRLNIEGRSVAAHRLAYTTLVGPIPDGLELDHRVCQTGLCCNPSHLDPVTHAENVRRGRLAETNVARGKARTHCIHGHEYTAENTIRTVTGRRACRVCSYANAAATNRRIRAERNLRRCGRKLTPAKVFEIRARLVAGERARLISFDMGCSEMTIHDIRAGRSWAHLKGG
jgi:hypothetical protein